jgi:hypothetical protein
VMPAAKRPLGRHAVFSKRRSGARYARAQREHAFQRGALVSCSLVRNALGVSGSGRADSPGPTATHREMSSAMCRVFQSLTNRSRWHVASRAFLHEHQPHGRALPGLNKAESTTGFLLSLFATSTDVSRICRVPRQPTEP